MKFKCTEYKNGEPYEWKYTLSKPFGNGFFIKVIFTSISNDIYLKKYYSDVLGNKLNNTVFFDCNLKFLKFVKYFKEKKYILLAAIPKLKLKKYQRKIKKLGFKKIGEKDNEPIYLLENSWNLEKH